MWIEDLCTYIRGQNISGIGQAVFIYTMKDTDLGALLVPPPTPFPVDPQLRKLYKGSFQLVVRQDHPKKATDIADAIVAQLDFTEQRLGNTYVNYVRPRHLPLVYPRSDGDTYEASVNFDLCFVDVSA